MKNILFTLAVLGFLALPTAALAQEHAIQPEQCRADVRLWRSQSKDELELLSVHDIQLRGAEMFNCLSVDTGNGESVQDYQRDSDNYLPMFTAYEIAAGNRALKFIKRHSMTKEFLDEDAAGQRSDRWPDEPTPKSALYDSGTSFLSWCDVASDFEKSMLPEERESVGLTCTYWIQGVMIGAALED